MKHCVGIPYDTSSNPNKHVNNCVMKHCVGIPYYTSSNPKEHVNNCVMKRSVGILRQPRHTMHLEVHATDRDQKYRDCSMCLSILCELFPQVSCQPNDFCHTILVSILHVSIFVFFSCINCHTHNNPIGHKADS